MIAIVTVLPEDTFGISKLLPDYRVETTFRKVNEHVTEKTINHYYSTSSLKARLFNLIGKRYGSFCDRRFGQINVDYSILFKGDAVDGAAILRLLGSHGFFQGFHFGSELVGLAFQLGVLCFYLAKFAGICYKPHVLRFERFDLHSDIDLFFEGVPRSKESLVTGKTLLAFPELPLDLRPSGFCEDQFRKEIEESGALI
jgi:hypothetical protein